MRLYEDEEYTMMLVGVVIYILITGFNVMLCIYPFGKKMLKFGSMSYKKIGIVDLDEKDEANEEMVVKKRGGVCASVSNTSLMEKGNADD